MPTIAFLAPDEEILATARTTLAGTRPDILLERGLLSAGVSKARKLAREGVEIMSSRGGTADAIKEARLGLTGVEAIRNALIDARGRRAMAAETLGISRSTLWRRMKSLGKTF